MAEDNGWRITDQRQVKSSQYLRDGIEWEPPLAILLANQYLEGRKAEDYTHLDHLIASQARLLEQLNETEEKRSLFTHAFLAE